MSVRLEWIEARNTRATVHACEDILADGQPVSEEFALALHTMVFEGSLAELLEMLEQAMALLGRTAVHERLEYLRSQLRAERISWGELAELQGLASSIDPGDVELLEAAGVPEVTEQWTIVWETGDGPEVSGIYADKDEALQAAHEEWVGFQGGVAGGFDTGSYEEFLEMYAESDKVWVVPVGSS